MYDGVEKRPKNKEAAPWQEYLKPALLSMLGSCLKQTWTRRWKACAKQSVYGLTDCSLRWQTTWWAAVTTFDVVGCRSDFAGKVSAAAVEPPEVDALAGMAFGIGSHW